MTTPNTPKPTVYKTIGKEEAPEVEVRAQVSTPAPTVTAFAGVLGVKVLAAPAPAEDAAA